MKQNNDFLRSLEAFVTEKTQEVIKSDVDKIVKELSPNIINIVDAKLDNRMENLEKIISIKVIEHLKAISEGVHSSISNIEGRQKKNVGNS